MFLLVFNIFNGFIISELEMNQLFYVRINFNLNLHCLIRKYTILTKCILNWLTVRSRNIIGIFFIIYHSSLLFNINTYTHSDSEIEYTLDCVIFFAFDYVFMIIYEFIIIAVKEIAMIMKFQCVIRYHILLKCLCFLRCTIWIDLC